MQKCKEEPYDFIVLYQDTDVDDDSINVQLKNTKDNGISMIGVARKCALNPKGNDKQATFVYVLKY